MTELFIDRMRVVLPSSFSIRLTRENPFFSKNGDYTLDLELSLEDPINAKIYKHCNRENSTLEVPLKRSAVLVSDNRVILKGTEVILKITETIVKIQLVSGNSELNYIISDQKIRTLDLGSAVLQTNVAQKVSLDYHYPDRDWQILPFMTKDSDFIGNSYYYIDYAPGVGDPVLNDILEYWGCYKPNTGMAEDFSFPLHNKRPQPYLCFIIKKVVEAIGYTMGTNVLALHSQLKNLYIVHGFDTLSFAKMLPDWTVSEFFNQIESAWDLTFVVNTVTKTVDLLYNYSSVENENIQVLSATDPFTKTIDRGKKYSNNERNIGYSFDDDEYYSLNNMKTAIKDVAINISLDEADPLIDLDTKIANTGDTNRFKKIFHDSYHDLDWIAFNNDGVIIPKRVDTFTNQINDTENFDKLDVELKIIPAAFRTMNLITDRSYVGGVKKHYLMQFPVVDVYDPLIFQRSSDQTSDFTMQGLLTSEDTLATAVTSDKMRLAVYNGRHYVDGTASNWIELRDAFDTFPMSFVEDLPEYITKSTQERLLLEGNPIFRLKWRQENIYHRMDPLDSKKEFERTFIDNGNYDIMKPFMINNRKYLCSKIEYIVNADGIEKLARGYFYQLT